MFEALRGYRCVVVTGPQRSGTTLAAHAVAYDTGLRYVDEDDYGTKEPLEWDRIVRQGKGIVVHSPAMARWVHEPGKLDDVFVIWMLRPTAQILISESRLEWSDKDERLKYEGAPDYSRQYPISGIKLRFWREHQRRVVRHWKEVHYEDLRFHPLWLPPEKRRNFGPRDWALDGAEVMAEI